jgi:hypothetical protein
MLYLNTYHIHTCNSNSMYYRHPPSKSANGDRHQKHHEVCRLVAQDRRENGTNAFNHRSTKMGKSSHDNGFSSEDDDGVDPVKLNVIIISAMQSTRLNIDITIKTYIILLIIPLTFTMMPTFLNDIYLTPNIRLLISHVITTLLMYIPNVRLKMYNQKVHTTW